MAFTSATLLSLEYGERYPWLPPVSYGLASITGLGRILNNRHWIGDVVTGAGLGILSGHIGYWISDRLFGSTGRQLKYYNEEPTPHLRLYAPITLSATPSQGEGTWSLQGRHAALGIEYTPPQWPLYLKGNVGLSTFRGQEGGDGLGRSAQDHYLSLRLGLGRDLRLWRGFHISASASAALRKHVGRATTFPANEPALYMPASSVGMGYRTGASLALHEGAWPTPTARAGLLSFVLSPDYPSANLRTQSRLVLWGHGTGGLPLIPPRPLLTYNPIIL